MEPLLVDKQHDDILIAKDGAPRYWILYYRFGNVPQLTKGFRLDGGIQEAINRGRKHCDLMDYKFLLVRPMVVNLDYQERLREEGKWKDPDSARSID